ncbi:hypothetical protein DL766_003334 [Monosporascus sp. MC13-8B]|uniref:CASP-like protein n=1 Tax=Monosporascus cannonballus TaxID=155416 RepID=A0ABY0H6K3_9PEZI|nr:hypothetical protein DL762_004821 [Monosporascus cannonballus]RYO93188.1 hypothetical protein DL763_004460 [Monosporascus cannonballus]RYP33705.1 hypothetical protein DL766_003334 [Monosporascus sp. MC13-8B]
MTSAPLPKLGLPGTGRAYDGDDEKCGLDDQYALEDGTLLWNRDRSLSSGLRTAASMCVLLALGLLLALHRHGLAKYQAQIMAGTFSREYFVGWT